MTKVASTIASTAISKMEAMMRCPVENFIFENSSQRKTYEFLCSGCIDAPIDIAAGSVKSFVFSDGDGFYTSCSTIDR